MQEEVIRKASIAATLSAACFLMFSGQAAAATTVGSTFLPSGVLCNDNLFALQTTSPSSEYVVPRAGVLTSWSHQASNFPPTNLKLEVGRTTATPDQFLVVGNSANKSPAAGVTSTYTDISIPVQAGDFLGLHSSGASKDCGVLAAGYTVNYFGVDPAPGDPVGPPTFPSGLRLDISATLEPDCDADGLGDQTQDPNTSSCNPPPGSSLSTTSAPTGQRAAALKKCKKKHGAARANCKKKAKKLPV